MRPGHLGIYRPEELDVREYSVRNGGRGGGGGGEIYNHFLPPPPPPDFLPWFPRPSLDAIHSNTLSLVTSKTEMAACSWQCNGKTEGYKSVL